MSVGALIPHIIYIFYPSTLYKDLHGQSWCQPLEILNLETLSSALPPPPPPKCQRIPAHKLTYGLGHYEVLHEVDIIKIYLHHSNDKIVFVSD